MLSEYIIIEYDMEDKYLINQGVTPLRKLSDEGFRRNI